MRTERTLDRRTANELSSKRIRERCNYFFLSPTFSLSLFFLSFIVSSRGSTRGDHRQSGSICGVISPGTPNHNPRERNIPPRGGRRYEEGEEEGKKRRSAHAVRIHPYWILFKGDTKNSFLSISREISPVNTRDVDRICSTDRSTIRANSTNFVGVDDARSLA